MNLHIELKQEDAGKKVRQVLQKHFLLSGHALRWLKFNAVLQVDEHVCKIGDLIPAGSCCLNVEMEADDARNPGTSLQIVYEDDMILVVCKPPGLCVHTSKENGTEALCDQVQAYLGCKQTFPVGRLDQEVEGFMVFGKNYLIASMLEMAKKNRGFSKTYLALCHGAWQKTQGEITAPIAKTEVFNRYEVRKDGKPALSRYQVIRNTEPYSIVQVQIETGRTHQIRLHMKEAGHPILGDQYYGIEAGQNLLEFGKQDAGSKNGRDTEIETENGLKPPQVNEGPFVQAAKTCQLYAARLELIHPVSKEKLCFEKIPDIFSIIQK